ncbi:MAG: hypothetical protein K2H38_05805 [Muribaculaceae bacterium]|nr:hypothetical protein [Muribaculaceae bacterium]
MENKQNSQISTSAETMELLLDTLSWLDCRQVDSPDDSIRMFYSGEGFILFVDDRNVRIWDPAWSHVTSNSTELWLMREAINITNERCRPTVILSVPDGNDIIHIHCKYYLMLYPSCTDNVEILMEALDSFFTTKQFLKQCSYDLFVTHVKNHKKDAQ